MNKYDADYQPRRCSATNRLIPAADYRSVQIALAEVSAVVIDKVDDSGVVTGKSQVFNISGPLRASGKSDGSLNRIFGEMGLISFKR